MSIESIPKDVWLQIFRYVSPSDMACKVSRVNKLFYNLSNDDSLWKTSYREEGETWKQAFFYNRDRFWEPYNKQLAEANSQYAELVKVVDEIVHERGPTSIKPELVFEMSSYCSWGTNEIMWQGKWWFHRQKKLIIEQTEEEFKHIHYTEMKKEQNVILHVPALKRGDVNYYIDI